MWQTFWRLILIGSLSVAAMCAASESAEVNLDYVAQRALERARTPFHSPRADLPKVLRQDNLDYEGQKARWARIRAQANQAAAR